MKLAIFKILITVLFLCAIFGIFTCLNIYTCKNYSITTGQETKYAVLHGCLVRYGNIWLPLSK